MAININNNVSSPSSQLIQKKIPGDTLTNKETLKSSSIAVTDKVSISQKARESMLTTHSFFINESHQITTPRDASETITQAIGEESKTETVISRRIVGPDTRFTQATGEHGGYDGMLSASGNISVNSNAKENASQIVASRNITAHDGERGNSAQLNNSLNSTLVKIKNNSFGQY